MKILLILASPDNDPLKGRHPFMPLSLPILASAAPDHEYIFHDMLWERGYPDFQINVDVVGISYRTAGEKIALYMADKFKNTGKKVVLGGPQPTVTPLNAIQHSDAVVIGEGEFLWPKVLEDIENDSLKHFYVCPPNQIETTDYSVFSLNSIPDISTYPVPYRRIFKSRYKFDMVYAAKGCPVQCDFCVVSDIYGKKCRLRNVEDVVQEISGLNRFFYLIDDTVFGRANTYEYYNELYRNIANLKSPYYWTGQGNLDAASHQKGQEVIINAAKSGLTYVAIGIESINRDTLQVSGSINKSGLKKDGDHIKSLEKNIRFIQQQGIAISGWFAIGYESDNNRTYFDTVDFCNRNHIFPVITPVHALPGSGLYRKLQKEGKLQDHENNITNVSHPSITHDDILVGMQYNLRRGYSFIQILINTWYYLKIFIRGKHSINDTVYKTIFTFVTQIKMKQIIRWEIKRMKQKIGQKRIHI